MIYIIIDIYILDKDSSISNSTRRRMGLSYQARVQVACSSGVTGSARSSEGQLPLSSTSPIALFAKA
jgi:hypothetical protein